MRPGAGPPGTRILVQDVRSLFLIVLRTISKLSGCEMELGRGSVLVHPMKRQRLGWLAGHLCIASGYTYRRSNYHDVWWFRGVVSVFPCAHIPVHPSLPMSTALSSTASPARHLASADSSAWGWASAAWASMQASGLVVKEPPPPAPPRLQCTVKVTALARSGLGTVLGSRVLIVPALWYVQKGPLTFTREDLIAATFRTLAGGGQTQQFVHRYHSNSLVSA